jgi:dolichyl-phosphate-mannose-protein mannosyltransferase
VPGADFPTDYNFDEMHYVVAAKLLVPPQTNANWEHPPLAKFLMGLGIAAAGDRPFGWRLGGLVFGAISVAGMYAWALALYRERGLALWVALLTLVNIMVFVLARVAMLEVYLLAFLVWGCAAASFAWDAALPARQARRCLAAAGILLGLASACKWVGLVPLLFVLLLWIALRLLQRHGSRLYRAPAPGAEEWYTPEMWRELTWRDAAAFLVAVPVIVYALSYLPFLAMPSREGSVKDILVLQLDMLQAQASIVGNHYYASSWYQWPFDWKPMWLYFHSAGGWTRAMLLIGNPLVLFAGLAAALLCAAVWWQRRTRESFLAAAWYWLLFLCFAVIPRKVSFFHYYLPAACALGLALAYVFRHFGGPPVFRRAWGRWAFFAAAAAIFLLFYPVLVGLPLPADFSPQ